MSDKLQFVGKNRAYPTLEVTLITELNLEKTSDKLKLIGHFKTAYRTLKD